MRSVTRKTKSNDTQGTASTADLVVSTLEQLLMQGESFTALSIDQISKKSGIARATFYLHFRNKGELVGQLMKRVGKEMRKAAKDSMAERKDLVRGDFLQFMKNAINVKYQHRAAIRAIIETASYDPDVAQVYQTFMDQMIGDTSQFIARLQATGLAHPDVSPDLAEVLTWAAERCCNQMLKDGDSLASRHRLAETLTHVVWSAIAAPGVKNQHG
jgi:AcrR family transcriptional regulator